MAFTPPAGAPDAARHSRCSAITATPRLRSGFFPDSCLPSLGARRHTEGTLKSTGFNEGQVHKQAKQTNNHSVAEKRCLFFCLKVTAWRDDYGLDVM